MLQRQPRPKGTTLLCQAYFHSNNKQDISLKQIHRHLLNQYFLNNQTLNGTYYSVDQMADYLNIPTIEVIRYMNKHLGYLQGIGANMTPEDISGQLRELIFRAINGSLHHGRQAQDQYDLLYKAQGGTHKAFVSQTVNQALSNLFAADQNIMNVIRLAMPNQGSGPNNGTYSPFLANQASSPKDAKDGYLTTESAVNLLEAKDLTSLLGDEGLKQQLRLTHNLDTMPEVRSNFQGTDAADAEQTETVDAEDELIVDKHVDRREQEFEDVDEIN